MAIVKSANDAIDAMNDVVDATGTTIENVSALQRVSKLYGHEVDLFCFDAAKFNKEPTSTIQTGQ